MSQRFAYSYTVIDPKSGQARTFRVTSDSRAVAATAIRQAVRQVNHGRRTASGHQMLPLPQLQDLEAAAVANAGTGRVSCYA